MYSPPKSLACLGSKTVDTQLQDVTTYLPSLRVTSWHPSMRGTAASSRPQRSLTEGARLAKLLVNAACADHTGSCGASFSRGRQRGRHTTSICGWGRALWSCHGWVAAGKRPTLARAAHHAWLGVPAIRGMDGAGTSSCHWVGAARATCQRQPKWRCGSALRQPNAPTRARQVNSCGARAAVNSSVSAVS